MPTFGKVLPHLAWLYWEVTENVSPPSQCTHVVRGQDIVLTLLWQVVLSSGTLIWSVSPSPTLPSQHLLRCASRFFEIGIRLVAEHADPSLLSSNKTQPSQRHPALCRMSGKNIFHSAISTPCLALNTAYRIKVRILLLDLCVHAWEGIHGISVWLKFHAILLVFLSSEFHMPEFQIQAIFWI